MPDYIVLRLLPDKPIAGASFTNYLNGLTITAFDLSTGSPTTGTQIGTATYLAPPNPATRIVQQPSNPSIPFGPGMEAIATAVIEINLPAGYKEYVSPDLRLEITRGGVSIFEKSLYYNVAVQPGPVPPPANYHSLGAGQVSFYLKLPQPVASGLASLNLSDDGSLPNFAELKNAINTVLGADQGPIPDISALSAAQARHIAYEIVWGPQSPLPQPPADATTGFDDLGAMYTDNPSLAPPAPPPGPNDGKISNPLEQNRQQFEGDLNSYYATQNAVVERLTRYIFAVSAAIACETATTAATSALLTFPINPNAPANQALIDTAQIVLIDSTGTGLPLDIPFTVSAEYFYVLGASLPVQMGADQRLKMASHDTQERMLPILTEAYNDGTIANPLPAINPAQAVRRLTALSPGSNSVAPICKLDAGVHQLVNDWLAFPNAATWPTYQPGDDPAKFWTPEFAVQPAEYLQLDLRAVTDNFQPLIDAILAIPVNTVGALAALTLAQWQRLFKITATTTATTASGGVTLTFGSAAAIAGVILGEPVSGLGIINSPTTTVAGFPAPNQAQLSAPVTTNVPSGTVITFIRPDLIPPMFSVGTFNTRLSAFLQYLQRFFVLGFGIANLPPASADAPPTLDLPTDDMIGAFVAAYEAAIGGPLVFGAGALNAADVDTAVQAVFPGDPPAQSWLTQRVQVINELCLLAAVVSAAPPPLNAAFSIAEALYARGFTSAADIQALSLADFTDALRGTVAFDQAAAIYARAGAAGPPIPLSPGPFQPVNPGTLVNCVPPCYLSPLGPVEYLHELLRLSEASSCTDPFASPPSGSQSLGDTVAQRRGPLGDLHVTAANAETQIPLIDIVNENLEFLAATLPAAPHGVVYDTAGDKLAGYNLCTDDSVGADGCYEPNQIFKALPEHSSPAVPVEQPAAYDKLKQDFTSPALPYSQPLDLCRSYLEHFKTCRFETMRLFRKEITEFALDPGLAAPPFQSHLWRYPVRIDVAIEYLGINSEEYALLFTTDIADVPTPGHLTLYELYGFDTPTPGGTDWVNIALMLPQFLKRTGLTYCELVDLQKSSCFDFVIVEI